MDLSHTLRSLCLGFFQLNRMLLRIILMRPPISSSLLLLSRILCVWVCHHQFICSLRFGLKESCGRDSKRLEAEGSSLVGPVRCRCSEPGCSVAVEATAPTRTSGVLRKAHLPDACGFAFSVHSGLCSAVTPSPRLASWVPLLALCDSYLLWSSTAYSLLLHTSCLLPQEM